MNFITQLNLGSGLEITISAAICFVITQAAKQTKISNHFMPWISMGTGVIAGEVVGISQGDSHYLSLAILGLLIGGATVGLFDGFKLPYQAAQRSKPIKNGDFFNTNDTDLSKPISADWKPDTEQQKSQKDNNAQVRQQEKKAGDNNVTNQ